MCSSQGYFDRTPFSSILLLLPCCASTFFPCPQERIEFADEVIAAHGASKIAESDVILTFASSHVVEMILRRAHFEGKAFRLIIVDARPKLEGKELLHRLLRAGIKCTYIHINALSYVMKDVTRVILGAAALLSNGAVIGRVGSAVVALMAKMHNVPLLICCETYKFAEVRARRTASGRGF